jgi:hypothetical protein
VKTFVYALLLSSLIATPAFAEVAAIPANAKSSGDLTGSSAWEWNHDAGTPGESVGSSSHPIKSPSLDDAAREFYVSYSHYGGEIYHLTFAHDATPLYFVYDTWVYLEDPTQVKNIELDVNQVISDGKTVILGNQCSGYSGTWEWAYKSDGHPHWHSSNIPCNPTKWKANTWHHVQVASHRNTAGVVTHDWVNVDGKISYFKDAAGPSALSLHWSPGDLLINFQLDGADSSRGDMKVYIDKLTIYRW